MSDLWPTQRKAINETLAAIAAGARRICVTGPTGSGKTRIACELIRHYLGLGLRLSLYTNRKLLVEQTSRVLEAAGHTHGVRAAGHASDHHRDLQVSSIQTEASRCLKRRTWQLHQAGLVLVDEAHLMGGRTAEEILSRHHEQGAVIVGLTATPIDLAHIYDLLVVAGTNSELRACGALLPCRHYGPDEPDLRHIGRVALSRLESGQDLTEPQARKAMMTPTVFGRVLHWYRKLNPDQAPTILFAPGVAESLWFAEQLHAKGISAAHIDGGEVWINGTVYRSGAAEARQDALEGSRDGSIRVLCNRFVLREGVDAPWLAHGVLATVFGSLQSYLQSGGRLLRHFPGLEAVTLQDHGGNWHRHGSLNADRIWNLNYTAAMYRGLREGKLRNGEEPQPCRCPQCGQILLGLRCPCGFVLTMGRKSRPVVQVDGTLKEMRGEVYKPRRTTDRPDAARLWEQMYHRAMSEKWNATFRQAEAMFCHEHGGWPPRDLPLMPVDQIDWFQKVRDVPIDRLRPKEVVQ